ncbi:hypothetical protein ACFP2T_33855 [Plantactinospora solaniradicis]|uniref:MFS transporter n=1 Tax=Plantactinospora solaniradicis TaxID=1723736 RepID=A0ABW1KHB1_9ACTN
MSGRSERTARPEKTRRNAGRSEVRPTSPWRHRRLTLASSVTGAVIVALGILSMSQLGPGSATVAIGGAFTLLGAGFGTVMVTATEVVVHQASVDAAGVAGGLQQTAMNVGPALGVATATMLLTGAMSFGAAEWPGAGEVRWTGADFTAAMRPTLWVLTGVAVLGGLLATRLPRRAGPVPVRRSRSRHSGIAAGLDRGECSQDQPSTWSRARGRPG